ncbi:MAG: transglycosylase SLT domain-containing protein, partial [Myxococcota bacterium]
MPENRPAKAGLGRLVLPFIVIMGSLITLPGHAGSTMGPAAFGAPAALDQDPLGYGLIESLNPLHRDPAAYRPWSPPQTTVVQPTAPQDLLERLRSDFSWPITGAGRTDAQRRWYVRHPEYLNRVFERGRPYLHHIMAELEARGMPAELSLLPIVESAFDPFAYSHGRAAGLWQFIPGTGRRFGLRQDWWYDGRRDVVAATDAALRYLTYLAGRYDGDFELAVAAYNCGEGTVDRAIKRNRNAGKPTDFWSLRLPRETSSYVPKLIALADIVARPDAFGLTLPVIADEPAIASVATGGQIDLALAANLAGMDVEELYKLNPGFNQWATSPDGPHRLVVPTTQAEQLTTALADLPAAERMRWRRHKVTNGQTLSHIADQYGISQRTIRDANQLRGTLIRVGQYLMTTGNTRLAPKISLSLLLPTTMTDS